MSNMFIPKEQQTAYQRWEMSDISHDDNETVIEEKSITPEELQAIAQQAKEEGFALGMQHGYADGLQQAHAEILSDKQNLLNLANTFTHSLDKGETEFSMEILKLALDVAKAMVNTHLQLNSKAILVVIKEITDHLPPDISQVRLRLHPDDADSVRKHLLEDLTSLNWIVLEDARITQGGCIVETAVKQIDARIETRWKRICDALGQDQEWLSSLK